MNIKSYLGERIFVVMINLGCLLLSDFILYMCRISVNVICIITLLFIISVVTIYGYEFSKKKSFLESLEKSTDSLDEKYLLSEVITEPDEQEFKEFISILRQCNKSMNDKINCINLREKEFREFIELWVHEVKTPIASAKLTIENNKDNITESIEEDITKVEYFIEQALFYARSGSVNKDFLIKKMDLEKVVNSSIRKYAKLLIKNRIKIVKSNLDLNVYSDDKWIEFILGQIISNSLKYFDKNEKILEFSAEENKDSITLIIKDNGRGIDEKYLTKIFDKGFTGDTGRNIKEATGIGLYLCKKLSNKLHINIKAESQIGMWTAIYIIFPKSSQFFLK